MDVQINSRQRTYGCIIVTCVVIGILGAYLLFGGERGDTGKDALLSKPPSNGRVKISEGKLLVDGEEFLIKGVAYSPTPIGIGYYNYDFYNYPEIYNRDFQLLRAMNANTIKTYTKVTNKDFLDAAYNDGNDPIYVIMGFPVDATKIYDNEYRKNIIAEFKDYVGTFKDHPAVLMWMVGNEMNYWIHSDELLKKWYTLLNDLAIAAYEVEGDNYHPVVTSNCEIDDIGKPELKSDDNSLSYLDAWGVTTYRDSLALLLSTYKTKTSKPIIFTELGCDAWNMIENREDEDTQASWAANLWNDMVKSDIVLGGTFFEWTDEWYKAGLPAEHNLGGYELDTFPDKYMNEEWFGIMRVVDNGTGPDILEPRQIYYTLQEKWA